MRYIKSKKSIIIGIVFIVSVLAVYLNIRWTERVYTEKAINAVLHEKGFTNKIKSETTMYDLNQDRFVVFVKYKDSKDESVYAYAYDGVYSIEGEDNKYDIGIEKI